MSKSKRLASKYIRPSTYLPPIVLIAAILIAWELLIVYFKIPQWLIPAPTAVFEKFLNTPTLPLHTQLTATESIAGFGLAALLGISLSILMAHSRFAESALLPYITLLSATPIVAIVPLLIIWFGFGLEPKILTSMIISLPPIVINTHKGLKSPDGRLYELMKSVDASTWHIIKKIEFPSAVPYIFAGFKIAMPLSIIGAVVAEYYGADKGLGYLVLITATQLQTELLFVAILVLDFMGVLSFTIFNMIEKHFAWGKE